MPGPHHPSQRGSKRASTRQKQPHRPTIRRDHRHIPGDRCLARIIWHGPLANVQSQTDLHVVRCVMTLLDPPVQNAGSRLNRRAPCRTAVRPSQHHHDALFKKSAPPIRDCNPVRRAVRGRVLAHFQGRETPSDLVHESRNVEKHSPTLISSRPTRCRTAVNHMSDSSRHASCQKILPMGG